MFFFEHQCGNWRGMVRENFFEKSCRAAKLSHYGNTMHGDLRLSENKFIPISSGELHSGIKFTRFKLLHIFTGFDQGQDTSTVYHFSQ